MNVVGPQVRKLRSQRGWTQEVLAQKLQLAGWDVSRTSLAKLESRLRWVSDCELPFLAKVLSVHLNDLFPSGLDLKKLGPQFRKTQPRRSVKCIFWKQWWTSLPAEGQEELRRRDRTVAATGFGEEDCVEEARTLGLGAMHNSLQKSVVQTETCYEN